MLSPLEKAVLANCLLANHRKNENGCWLTEYGKINALRVDASSTNGTSGIGKYKGHRVYWWLNHTTGKFEIEPA